jgi:hypothetical protein
LPGGEGDPADVGPLQDALKNATELVDLTFDNIANLSVKVKDIELEFTNTTKEIDKRTEEINALVKEMMVEVTQEVNIIAEQTCRSDFTKKAGTCCPNCTDAKFRVPPKQECESAGCEHSCAYVNATCDKHKKKLSTGCLFPFKYLGKEQKSCITASPFGEVTRPWCYLDTEQNVERADDGKEPLDIGFCDCTELRCFCPPGQRLGSDRKTCVDVALIQLHDHQEDRESRSWKVLNPKIKSRDNL